MDFVLDSSNISFLKHLLSSVFEFCATIAINGCLSTCSWLAITCAWMIILIFLHTATMRFNPPFSLVATEGGMLGRFK